MKNQPFITASATAQTNNEGPPSLRAGTVLLPSSITNHSGASSASRAALFILMLHMCFYGSVSAQGTAFTYQGRLNDQGVPANGVYDLQVSVWDSLAGGAQSGTVAILDDVA